MNNKDIETLLSKLNIRGNGKTEELLAGLSNQCVVITQNANMSSAYRDINPYPKYVTVYELDSLVGVDWPIMIDHEVLKDMLMQFLYIKNKYDEIKEIVDVDYKYNQIVRVINSDY